MCRREKPYASRALGYRNSTVPIMSASVSTCSSSAVVSTSSSGAVDRRVQLDSRVRLADADGGGGAAERILRPERSLR